jgi:hypothetical protein
LLPDLRFRFPGCRLIAIAGPDLAIHAASAQVASMKVREALTIAGKPSEDLAPGTLDSILKQAGLKEPH